MARERKDGSGALFANDKKGNERAPDWKGDIMINGTVHRISAWTRKSQDRKSTRLNSSHRT